MSDEKTVPPIGTVLAGKYEVEHVIGAGAMGVVIAAQHRLLRQRVALKLIAGSREARSTAVARFTREARAIAGLTSDHIVRILDFGLLDERTPFMAMQYLPGRDLASEVTARGGKLPQSEAVDHVIHACAGLAVAHAAGIVHRDIKPGNLLLTTRASGEPLVVIVDFGISKALSPEDELSLTLSQTTLGSPLYMSPEQIRDSKTVDRRTDIWSLGVVLQFLLTGKPAFTAGDASGVLAAVIADEPAPLRSEVREIDAGLEDVVSRCLQKKPAFRYGSVAELAQALAPYASEAGAALARTIAGVRTGFTPTPPNDVPPRTHGEVETLASMTRGPRPSRRPTERRLAVIGIALVLASAGAALTRALTHRPSPPADLAVVTSAPPAVLSSRAVAVLAPAREAPPAALRETPVESSSAAIDAGPPALSAVPRRPHAPPSGPGTPRTPGEPSPAISGGAPAAAGSAGPPSDPFDTAK